MLNIVNDVTRECLRAVVDTSISGRRVVRELTDLIAERGRPKMIVSDNGTGRDAGTLQIRYALRNGRVLYNLDKAEVDRLVQVRRTRLSSSAIGLRLAIAPYAVDQLVAAKIIGSDDHAWLVQTHGRPQVTEADLARFLDSIGAAASPIETLGPHLPLHDAMRGYGGGAKPWAEVFRRMLAGDLAFALLDGGTSTRHVLLSEFTARLIWLIPPADINPFYSQLDALDILNLGPKKGGALTSLKMGQVEHRKWLLAGEALASVAAERMFFGELVIKVRRSTLTVRCVLLERGVEEPTIFGWKRDRVFSLADDLLRSPKAATGHPTSGRNSG